MDTCSFVFLCTRCSCCHDALLDLFWCFRSSGCWQWYSLPFRPTVFISHMSCPCLSPSPGAYLIPWLKVWSAMAPFLGCTIAVGNGFEFARALCCSRSGLRTIDQLARVSDQETYSRVSGLSDQQMNILLRAILAFSTSEHCFIRIVDALSLMSTFLGCTRSIHQWLSHRRLSHAGSYKIPACIEYTPFRRCDIFTPESFGTTSDFSTQCILFPGMLGSDSTKSTKSTTVLQQEESRDVATRRHSLVGTGKKVCVWVYVWSLTRHYGTLEMSDSISAK